MLRLCVTDMSKSFFNSDDALTGKIDGKLGVLWQLAICFGIFASTLAGYFLLGEHRDDPAEGSDPGPAVHTDGYGMLRDE
eukprot:gene1786-13329_t